MEYIKIVNWEQFQHYKKRNPPWIKLHTQLLDNDEFECLRDDSKLLLLCLWLFNARKGNGEVRADRGYLRKKLPIQKIPPLQPLIDAGFIEVYQDDSKTIASCKQNGGAEERQRRGRDREREEKNKHLDFVFLTAEEYEKLLSKFGLSRTTEFIEELNNGIGSKGYKYKSHYHTILSWERRKAKEKAERDPPPKKCIHCGKPGVYVKTDDSGQKYWLCEDDKPKEQPLKGVPQPQLKTVPGKASAHDRRNQQKDALGVR